MQIAVDIRCLTDRRLTGVGLYTLNLVNAMATLAPDVNFLLFASGTNDTLDRLPRFPHRNITIVERAIPNKLMSGMLKLPFGKPLEDTLPSRPDAWFFPHPHIVKTRLPYAVTVHDLTLNLLPNFFTFKDHLREWLADSKAMALGAKRVLAVSENTARDLTAHWSVPTEHITVSPLGVDTESYLAREQSSDRSFRAAYDLNRPYLLTLCTLEPRKNIESIIEAYDMFRQEGGTALPLVIAGGKGWKAGGISTAITNSPFKHDIRLLGYIPEKHKPALYRGASAFLFPSFYEGFGLPVLEALASGVPVVTSFASSLPEVAGDAALYVDPFNVTDLTQALHILFGPDGNMIRASLREKGIAQATRFSWTSTAQTTLAALRAII